MPPSIAQDFLDAGQSLTSAPNLVDALNQVLNRFVGWPYRAAAGLAFDLDGKRSATFGMLIYTQPTKEAPVEPIEISADRLACSIDVSETLDLDSLRSAYARISDVKALKKSLPPKISGSAHTTITLGLILARTASVPIEILAEELDSLNQQTPDNRWPDMVVILSNATISYAVQFPGERIMGDFLPPAEGALASNAPPMYVILAMRPTGNYTFNRMCAFVIAHLAIFLLAPAFRIGRRFLVRRPKIRSSCEASI